jgi:hypothetical protein
MSVLVATTGITQLDACLEDMASQILDLQRQVAALQTALIAAGAGAYIGTVVNADIPAATDDDTPGVGLIEVRQLYTGSSVDQIKIRGPGFRARVLNLAQGADGPILLGKQVISIPILNTPGYQVVIFDPCPPT